MYAHSHTLAAYPFQGLFQPRTRRRRLFQVPPPPFACALWSHPLHAFCVWVARHNAHRSTSKSLRHPLQTQPQRHGAQGTESSKDKNRTNSHIVVGFNQRGHTCLEQAIMQWADMLRSRALRSKARDWAAEIANLHRSPELSLARGQHPLQLTFVCGAHVGTGHKPTQHQMKGLFPVRMCHEDQPAIICLLAYPQGSVCSLAWLKYESPRFEV